MTSTPFEILLSVLLFIILPAYLSYRVDKPVECDDDDSCCFDCESLCCSCENYKEKQRCKEDEKTADREAMMNELNKINKLP